MSETPNRLVKLMQPKMQFVDGRWQMLLKIPAHTNFEQALKLLPLIKRGEKYYSIALDKSVIELHKEHGYAGVLPKHFTFTKLKYTGTRKNVQTLLDLHMLSL